MFGLSIDGNGRRYSKVGILTAEGYQSAWILGPRRAVPGRFLLGDPSGRHPHPSLLFEEKP